MDEKELLRAQIEKLTAEKQRRIAEKIEKGLAVRASLPLVVGVPAPGRDYAAVRRDAEGREVYPPEDCPVIITGVPRAGRDDGLPIPMNSPSYPPAGIPTVEKKPKPSPEPIQFQSAGEWKYVRATVRRPDPEKDDPGQIKEGWHRLVGDLLRVEDKDGRTLGTVTVQPGDDTVAAARKILRESHGRHGAFYDPIKYSRSYH